MESWKVPVTRLRRASGGLDQYGEPLPGVEAREVLPGALFAPGGTSEPIMPGAAPVVSSPTLYWPGEYPDVVEADRLLVASSVYEVEGRPARWPLGLAVALRAVEAVE